MKQEVKVENLQQLLERVIKSDNNEGKENSKQQENKHETVNKCFKTWNKNLEDEDA